MGMTLGVEIVVAAEELSAAFAACGTVTRPTALTAKKANPAMVRMVRRLR